jgi:simple sugar transport system permease protein
MEAGADETNARASDPGRPVDDDPLPPVRKRGVVMSAMLRPEAGGVVSALLVFLFFAVAAGQNGFLSPLGTANWLDTAADLGIVALPVGMLMIGGEFDLSVGAVVGAASMIVAICSGYFSLNPWVGVGLAFLAGGLVGVANGLIVVRTKLPSFIVTLATMLMISGGMLGVAIALTGSSSISAVPSGSAQAVFASKLSEFHVSILHWIVLSIVATYVMQRTAFGNWVYATGGSADTARLAGVPVDRVKIVLFVCTSLAAVLSGVNETLTFQNGSITLGSQYVFTGIAAAVIGGVLLTGGYGSPVGTMFGALTYGIVSLGVFFLGWNTDLASLFVGLLLLLAVLANHRLRQLAMGRT